MLGAVLGSCPSQQHCVNTTPNTIGVSSFAPQHLTIDKDRRRPGHPGQSAPLNVGANPLIDQIAVHVAGELVYVEVELPGIRDEGWARIVEVLPFILIAI